MNKIKARFNTHVDPDVEVNGLIYGIIAALTFSIITWGIDAVLSAFSSVGFPWIKFIIGAILCSLIGGFVGWMTARLDSTIFGVVGWLGAGFLFAWIASRLPFAWLSTVISWIDPKLGEILSYPFPESVRYRMVVVYSFVVICSLLIGALEMIIVDSASRAASTFMRFATLAAAIPLIALGSFVTREYINSPMDNAILSVNQLIQNGLLYENKPVDKQTLRDLHLRALEPIKQLIHRPYRLYIENYDQEYFDSFNVLINFDGVWVRCSTVVSSIGVCKLLDESTAAARPSQLPPSTGSGQALIMLTPTPQPQSTSAPPKGTPKTPMLSQTELPPGLSEAPRYDISLDVDYERHAIKGRSQVEYTNAEDVPLEQVYFRLIPNGHASYGNGSLGASQVLIDSQPAEIVLSGNDTILQVKLPSSLQPGEKVTIDMAFAGQIPVDFGGDENEAGYGIYNFTQGVLALASWYPILAVYDDQGWNLDLPSYIGDSVYSDMAYYTVDVSVPEDMVVASTGVEIARQKSKGSDQIRFESGPARDFFLIMSPDFQVVSRTIDGTDVNSYYLPNHAQAGRTALNVATDSLQIFNDQLGPYPYTELDLVDAPMKNALGVEFPGIFLVGSSIYDKPDDPGFATTTAHEAAHQWWYNIVGNDVFEDPWLDEALTTYSSSFYYEFKYSPSAAQGLYDYWQQRHDDTLQKGWDDQITLPLSHFEALNNPAVYGRIVYTKGALFFKALRQEIGDRAFFETLQEYYREFQYKIANPPGLLNLFEENAGRQLDDFFQEWLYSPTTPK
jgi:hypothetical protein